ncbi:MAG: hypothetical protein WCV67_08450 [Victivallaceae bacterium]|jgi:hypothetical protein
MLICGLLPAVLIGAVLLRSFNPVAPAHQSPVRKVSRDVKTSEHAKPVIKREPAPKWPDESGSKKESGAAVVPATEAKTLREQAVASWENQIDDVIAYADVPAKESSWLIKAAFDKLYKDDQFDGIHYGLNLLPDEQFPGLYGILYDKNEDPEVLDAIFSDALNRSEEIKMTVLKSLRKDREHPMFFESSRILDVIETEEEKMTRK